MTAGIFVWNATGQAPYIGVRFTEPPVNAGWLGLAVFAYTVVRFVYRRSRDKRGQG